MAYKQSPAKVIKGQMTNKAAGLAHGDSMAMMGFTQNTDQKKKPQISTGRKILNTASQLVKDIGYQARDIITPDPVRMPTLPSANARIVNIDVRYTSTSGRMFLDKNESDCISIFHLSVTCV